MLYTPGSFGTPYARIESDTSFPAGGSVRLKIADARKKEFTLYLRVPRWTRSFNVTVGKQKLSGKPGTLLPIQSEWEDGDTVQIEMDMTVRLLPGKDNYPGAVAVARGAQVLAAENSLNPETISVRPTLAAVQPVPPPATWDGKQVYTADGVTFVPFADAVAMRVWIPVR